MKPEDKQLYQGYTRPTYSPSFVTPPATVAPGVDVTPVVSMPVAKPADDSLNQNYIGSSYDSSLETPNVGMTPTNTSNTNSSIGVLPQNSTPSLPVERFSAFHFNRTASLITLTVVSFIVLIGIGSFMFNSFGSKNSASTTTQNSGQPSTQYGVSSLPLQGLSASSDLQAGVNQLTVNGQLQVNDTIILSPTVVPSTPVVGQFYYNKAANQPYYYNGTTFVSLSPVVTAAAGTPTATTAANVCVQGATNCGFALAGSGVTSVNGLAGALTIANATGAGTTITVQDASTTQKGLAQFNAADFKATTGVIDTIQGITTTSNVQFASLGLGTTSTTGNLTLGATGSLIANTLTHTGTGNNLVLNAGADNVSFVTGNGANTFFLPTSGGAGQTLCTTAITCAAGGGQAVILEPAGIQSANANTDSVAINKASGTGNLIKLQAGGVDAFVISGTGASTIGSTTQAFTLQGNTSSSITATSGANSTTVGFITPTANRVINFPDSSGTVCTTSTCATISGSNSYIQNQNSAQQATSNFWLSGSGRADTSFLTPTLDTASAVALNIGATASAINLNQSTLLTGNLTIASGASRTLSVATPGTNVAGSALTIAAGSGGAGATGVAGSTLTLQAGNAAGTTGAAAGGNVFVKFGSGINGGAAGAVIIMDSSGSQYFKFDSTGAWGTLTCGLNLTNNCNIIGGNGLNLSSGQTTGGITINPGSAGAIVKPLVNTVTAFQVQNAAATSILNVDSTNQRVSIGSIGTATGQLYVAGMLPTVTNTLATGATNAQFFTVQGRYAYIANNSTGNFMIIDTTRPANMAVISTTTPTGMSSPYAVAVAGKYAYVTNNADTTNSYGLEILDISNPSAPILVGHIGTNVANTGGARQLVVQGRYVFLVNAVTNTIQSFDVANPAAPVALATQSTGTTPISISISGRYAYVTNQGASTFTVFDISNPSSIPAGTAWTTNTATPIPVAVSGRYAYVMSSTGASSFQVFDISNPTVPAAAIGSTTGGATPISLYVQGRYAYVAYNGGNFQIFDISNPTAPSSIGTYATGLSAVAGLTVSGRYAYITASTGISSLDLGGTYSQQLEAGGIETGTLQVNNNAHFGNNVSVANSLQVGQSLQVSGNIGSSGSVLFQNTTNSTTALQVQNAAGTAVLVVDSTNSRVGIGTNAPTTDLSFGSGSNRTIGVNAPSTNAAGNTLTLAAADAGAGATGMAGANLVLKAGSAAGTTGAAVGGNVVIHWGAAVNGAPSADGTVKIQDAAGNDYFQFDNGSTVGSNGSMTCGLFFSNPCSLRANNTLNLVANQAAAAVNLFPGTAGAVVKPSANTVTDFTVQNAAGTAIFTTDSTNSQIILGTSSSINGQLKVMNATNANAVTLVTGVTSSSYSLTLPTAGPAVSQCLQSDATTASLLKFSNCSNTHSKTVVLTAEYAGAVLDAGSGANNSGTMTSGIDLTNRENYYKWVTTQATSQSYDVDIQVPVPSDFSSWGATPISFDTYSTDTTNGTIQVEARTTAGTVETNCNFAAITPTIANTWQTKTCTIAGTYTAGGYMTLRLRMYATSAVTAVRVGNITLSYNSAY